MSLSHLPVERSSAASIRELDTLKMARLLVSLDQSSFTARHLRLYATIMFAHLTDGFDLLMIGVVLPGIIAALKLSPQQAGFFASSVFFGMMLGAALITYLADRIGRKRTLVICVAVYTVASLLTGFAWSYGSILVMRFVQGLALGAEVPIVLTYILEFVPARRRGMLSGMAVCLWQFGGLFAALTAILVIPAFSWRGMFVAAAIAGAIALVLLVRMPESVRYLAGRKKFDEVDALVRRFSDVDPGKLTPADIPVIVEPHAKLSDIVRGRYLRVTLGAWIMSMVWGMAYFGMSTWLPSILIRMGFTELHSFGYTAAIVGVGATGVLISGVVSDVIGRRPTIMACFFIGGACMFAWGDATTAPEVLAFGMLATFFGTGGVAGCLFTYISEIYPTHFRANASGIAGAWQRIGGMIAPPFLGFLIGTYGGVFGSFAILGLVLMVGAVAAFFLTIETKGKSLEQITAAIAGRRRPNGRTGAI